MYQKESNLETQLIFSTQSKQKLHCSEASAEGRLKVPKTESDARKGIPHSRVRHLVPDTWVKGPAIPAAGAVRPQPQVPEVFLGRETERWGLTGEQQTLLDWKVPAGPAPTCTHLCFRNSAGQDQARLWSWSGQS